MEVVVSTYPDPGFRNYYLFCDNETFGFSCLVAIVVSIYPNATESNSPFKIIPVLPYCHEIKFWGISCTACSVKSLLFKLQPAGCLALLAIS